MVEIFASFKLELLSLQRRRRAFEVSLTICCLLQFSKHFKVKFFTKSYFLIGKNFKLHYIQIKTFAINDIWSVFVSSNFCSTVKFMKGIFMRLMCNIMTDTETFRDIEHCFGTSKLKIFVAIQLDQFKI